MDYKKTIVTAAAIAVLAVPTAAAAAEEGATFYEDGSCNEADGTPGQSQPDGECFTIADYDEMFSFKALSEAPSYFNPGVSVAEEAGIVDDETPPSERPLGEGVTAEPHRFVDMFAWANGLPIRLA